MKNILVAIEDCETTTVRTPIVEKTLELAAALSGKVWILHVVPPSHESPYNVDSRVLRHASASELCDEHDFLQHLARCMHEKGVAAQSLLVEGSVINAILHESERLQVDLIVLGCHTHSRIYSALVGNTDEGLLSRCARPVMFVPT